MTISAAPRYDIAEWPFYAQSTGTRTFNGVPGTSVRCTVPWRLALMSPRGHAPVSQSAVAFHDAMRKLWEDHITYTRNVIVSFELNEPDPGAVLPDLGTVVDRILGSPEGSVVLTDKAELRAIVLAMYPPANAAA